MQCTCDSEVWTFDNPVLFAVLALFRCAFCSSQCLADSSCSNMVHFRIQTDIQLPLIWFQVSNHPPPTPTPTPNGGVNIRPYWVWIFSMWRRIWIRILKLRFFWYRYLVIFFLINLILSFPDPNSRKIAICLRICRYPTVLHPSSECQLHPTPAKCT